MQLGVALHRDELAGVDGHVLRELTLGDEVLAARKGLRHVQPVDVTSEHEHARRRDGRRFRARGGGGRFDRAQVEAPLLVRHTVRVRSRAAPPLT